MNDTQSYADEQRPVTQEDVADEVAALAELDPAAAPAAAERYAEKLAAELEAAGAPPSEPVQMQADLGTESER